MSEETDLDGGVSIALIGGMLRLRRYDDDGEDHVIYLEPETMDAINAYAVQIGFQIKAVTPKEDEKPSPP